MTEPSIQPQEAACGISKPGAGGRPIVSIILVSYNCRTMLGGCIGDLTRACAAISHEIIIVDNASGDGTADWVAAVHPGVRLLRNADNLGFAGGVNCGLALAGGEYILLVNPDVRIPDHETLPALIAFLAARPEIAAASCRLVFPDGQHQVGDAGYRPTLRNSLAYACGLSNMAPRHVNGLMVASPDSIVTDWIPVDWLCGAFLLVRRETIKIAGPLDESFFLYGEDIEWCCRMRERNFLLAYLPGLQVKHIQAGTQRSKDETPSTRWLDGLAQAFVKLNGARQWRPFKMSLSAGLLLRGLVYALLGCLRGDIGNRRKAAAMMQYSRHARRMPLPNIVSASRSDKAPSTAIIQVK